MQYPHRRQTEAHLDRLFALVLGTLLFEVLFLAGTRAWFGGWSFGPRLMVSGFSFLAIGVGWGLVDFERSLWTRIVSRGLLLWSVVYQLLV